MTSAIDELKPVWAAVDAYFGGSLLPADPVLEAALADSAAADLPAINVSPLQGKLLHLLALTIGAKRILEIGTLGGYSTIWLGRAVVAGGKLITLEAVPKHADVARANIARAGLSQVVEIQIGKALDLLPSLEGEPPFDLVFIDADKVNTTAYFDWSLKLTRRGSLILVDNVARKGAVIDEASDDENVKGMRQFMAHLAGERRVTATAIQTVGSKGYDGFVLARVNP